jgi:hypothetical protein
LALKEKGLIDALRLRVFFLMDDAPVVPVDDAASAPPASRGDHEEEGRRR